MIQHQEFRAVLGSYTTGVAVATASLPNGSKVGLTINSFTSVSLDPPLVLFCLEEKSLARPVFEHATGFAINVLSAEQEPLSRAFAKPGQGIERWQGLTLTKGQGDGLLIEGALATLDCLHEEVYPAGDHLIIVGRVVALSHREGAPLVYWRSGYRQIANNG